jgi:hypothetical protein
MTHQQLVDSLLKKAASLPPMDRRLLIAELRHLSRNGTYADKQGRGGAVVRLWWN